MALDTRGVKLPYRTSSTTLVRVAKVVGLDPEPLLGLLGWTYNSDEDADEALPLDRLGVIEERLGRVETLLDKIAGGPQDGTGPQ